MFIQSAPNKKTVDKIAGKPATYWASNYTPSTESGRSASRANLLPEPPPKLSFYSLKLSLQATKETEGKIR